VCISSINNITFVSSDTASAKISFILSSNSHLYFVQAITSHKSNDKICLFISHIGTSQLAILCASHSAIAVFQTQASHKSTGLFLVFLFKVLTTLSISKLLHITGSNFHFNAKLFKFVEK